MEDTWRVDKWRMAFDKATEEGFPGGSDSEASACNVGDPGSIPGLGRSLGEGNGNPVSSPLAGKIPWTEETGRLKSMG